MYVDTLYNQPEKSHVMQSISQIFEDSELYVNAIYNSHVMQNISECKF